MKTSVDIHKGWKLNSLTISKKHAKGSRVYVTKQLNEWHWEIVDETTGEVIESGDSETLDDAQVDYLKV